MDTDKNKICIPLTALLFQTKDKSSVKIGKDDQLSMIIYSGGLIKEHWYWNNLAIDLSGMSFPKKKYPILESHNTDKKIAFTGIPLQNGNLKIDPETTIYVDTDSSKEFRKLSKEGFPYEASMYAKPTIIERVEENAEMECNGMTVKGPATIWRKSIFKEASICVFGWDSKTESTAFSQDVLELAVEGFDEDDLLANNLFDLAQNGLRNNPESIPIEDADLAADLYDLSQGNDLEEEESLADDDDSEGDLEEDDKLAEEIYRTGRET